MKFFFYLGFLLFQLFTCFFILTVNLVEKSNFLTGFVMSVIIFILFIMKIVLAIVFKEGMKKKSLIIVFSFVVFLLELYFFYVFFQKTT